MGKYEKETRPQTSRTTSARSTSPARSTSGTRSASASRSTPASRTASGSRSAPASRKPAPKKKKSNLPLILGILIALVVVAACVGGYIMFHDNGRISQNVYIAGIDVGGMTREEALQALQKVSLDQDMNIRFYSKGDTYPLYTTTYDPSVDIDVDIYGKPLEEAEEEAATAATEAPTEEIITDEDAPKDENGVPYVLDQTLTLPAADVQFSFDKESAVEEAYKIGRESGSKFNADRVDVDISKYVTANEDFIRQSVVTALEDTVCIGTETRIEDTTTILTDSDGNPKTVNALEISLGTIKRDVEISKLFDEIIKSYTSGNFEMQYIYDEVIPEPIDLDALFEQYHCVKPINAVCDEETYEVTEGKNGFGFLMKDAVKAFKAAKPGDSIILTMCDLEPMYTAESLQKELFCDVLASYDSPHSTYSDIRTHNLELAAAAVNGTIVRPGEVFSFNDTVGERTPEKGYGAAPVYVGGRTENQTGGGVCQVASVIFYCTLKADLEVVKRYEHQYRPDYVPLGMDATVYWGELDYKFRNNTTHPIRIDASVSGGYVHVAFIGTETKDYTCKLDYKVTAYDEATTKTIDISPSMYNYAQYRGYSEGEVIQTAYDGYSVTTYRYKYDLDGNLIDTEIVCYSNYDRRDREIAHIVEDPPETQPTEPATEPPTTPPTEPPTEPPTTPPTEEGGG